MMLPVLALVAVSFSPPAPTVGDLITVRFEGEVALEPSEQYEIVSQEESTTVIRTFQPVPLLLSGRTGDTGFRNLVIPVRSVLRPDDDLTPAPLAPPLSSPYPRAPFVAIALAALAAAVAWSAVWLALRRQSTSVPVASVPPAERFRRAVMLLKTERDLPRRWAALADETRIYLAVTRSSFGSELTTSELVPRLGEGERVVADILRQGDLEKFSRSGAAPVDFDSLAARALDLAKEPEPDGQQSGGGEP
ncbi:MAG TPA: hypothetical protein VF701_07020 [Thermoanaerobaculia bacterium]